MEKEKNIVNLQEWEAQKTRERFGSIAQEIRDGTLQIHFGDNSILFAKTDEVLHFALVGEKLTMDLPNYQEQRIRAKDEILRNLHDIEMALSRYPKNDCLAVRESIAKMKLLADQIKN